MQTPRIISFYTQDWEYPQHARRLSQECTALGLQHRIDCRSSTGSYLGNTCMKSQFVRECLDQETDPLLWIDVDGSIYRHPRELESLDGYDMAARRRRQVNEYGYAWHVGTLWFAPTPATREFVRIWSEHSTGTDENRFQEAWRQMQDRIRIYELPEQYFFIYNSTNRHNLPLDTVIAHRISRSDMKLREKEISRQIRAARRRDQQVQS